MTDLEKELQEWQKSQIQWERHLFNGIKDDLSNEKQWAEGYYLLQNDPTYYISSYACPTCAEKGNLFNLYKMKARGRMAIFNDELVDLYNIFTCPICRYFYASVDAGREFFNKPLSEYALVSKHYADKNEYLRVLSETL